MKRKALIRHLERNGCEFFPEGKKHTVYINRAAQTSSTLPRHNEVKDILARKICRDLKVPEPKAT